METARGDGCLSHLGFREMDAGFIQGLILLYGRYFALKGGFEM